MALKLVITPAARLGLNWFRIYYLDYFPEGMLKANQRFEKICRLLCERPMMGRKAGKGGVNRASRPANKRERTQCGLALICLTKKRLVRQQSG